MFQHILAPIDLGRGSERALRTALGMARQWDARVTLLHVVQRIEHVPAGEVRSFYRKLALIAQRRLDRAARRFSRHGLDVRTVVCVGGPPEEIIRYVEGNAVDLIVLGSHPVDLDRRGHGWGTTSYKVGILCRCPVLLVK
jgi:nucleotide-binding universal stress UspA family protein